MAAGAGDRESDPAGGGFSFPRRVRLRRSEDFAEVNRARRRAQLRFVEVRWRNHPDPARFGLAVSRKVGNAVARNRVKRWLREAIRHERHVLTGVDVVFIARPSAAEAGAEAIRAEVASAFVRIRSAA